MGAVVLDPWIDTPASELRACDLCLHGCGPQGDRQCTHPEATYRQPIPVVSVRAYGGACGPEARHLHIASWGRPC